MILALSHYLTNFGSSTPKCFFACVAVEEVPFNVSYNFISLLGVGSHLATARLFHWVVLPQAFFRLHLPFSHHCPDGVPFPRELRPMYARRAVCCWIRSANATERGSECGLTCRQPIRPLTSALD